MGIGVATGPAFVGNIRAVDRMIWSAIGNTTNRAARLQGLTRELDAAMVIDAATWQVLGEAARDFDLRPRVAIRGRSEPEDLYILGRSLRSPVAPSAPALRYGEAGEAEPGRQA